MTSTPRSVRGLLHSRASLVVALAVALVVVVALFAVVVNRDDARRFHLARTAAAGAVVVIERIGSSSSARATRLCDVSQLNAMAVESTFLPPLVDPFVDAVTKEDDEDDETWRRGGC